MRVKSKTWPQKATSKARKIRKEKFTRNKTWKDFTAEDEMVQHILIGRPRMFKSPEELLSLFDDYILSCVERVKYAEEIPVETEAKIKPAKDWRKNKLLTQYEIWETVKRKTTPTKWGFCIFLWWISHTMRNNYKAKEEFVEAIERIENYLESILVQHANEWKVNPSIAQFVLNTTYNRVPKSKSEVVEKSEPLDVNDFIRD